VVQVLIIAKAFKAAHPDVVTHVRSSSPEERSLPAILYDGHYLIAVRDWIGHVSSGCRLKVPLDALVRLDRPLLVEGDLGLLRFDAGLRK